MNREIKFRGRDENGKWWYGDLRHTMMVYGQAHIRIIDNGIDELRLIEHWSDRIVPETVGQFTGAFDCEGREIYEGDILSACYGHAPNIIEVTGVVEFVHSGFALRFGKDAGVWLDQLIHAEIVGNIHDNPGLLKGGHV